MPEASDADGFFPRYALRDLGDKIYEKRRSAALQLERIVWKLSPTEDKEKINSLIDILNTEYTFSLLPDMRKGGLIGLVAITMGLEEASAMFIEKIVPPILDSLIDEDCKVRYYACEALYNIAKIARGEFVVYFSQTFDALCKLSIDQDTDVQNAAHVLDRLLMDIVTESDRFSIEEFIPLFREYIDVAHPCLRHFLIRWIAVLDSIPDNDMLSLLPDILDGLFDMLSDSSVEVRQKTDSALSEFLKEIKNSLNVDYGRMTEILVKRARSSDDYTRLTAITWINTFVKLFCGQLNPYYAHILGAILPLISDRDDKIQMVARETNEMIRPLPTTPSLGFNIGGILSVAQRELASEWQATKIEALHWFGTLMVQCPAEVISYLKNIFVDLLDPLFDSSDEVILLVLELHACIAHGPLFHRLVTYLAHNFQADYYLLELRGRLIICRLCTLFGSDQVYRTFSEILEGEDDLEFVSIMVQALNLILLTSSELADLRALLRKSLVTVSGKDLFLSLYATWCHSPMATLSLCLLAQAYNHAGAVINVLGEDDINVRFLVQMDKLVHMLETPVFAYLKLQLLDPETNTSLVKVMYSLLMLLPQPSEGFKILRKRLKGIPTGDHVFNRRTRATTSNNYPLQTSDEGLSQGFDHAHEDIDFRSRLQQFEKMQKRHSMHAKLKRRSIYTAPSALMQDIQNLGNLDPILNDH